MTLVEAWNDALQAAELLAVDPGGLGGICLRARAGPARDAWLDQLANLDPERPCVRLPPRIGDERLLGGLDLASTLAAGRPVCARGLLESALGKSLVLPMAERAAPGLAARIAAQMDRGIGFSIVLLDEGADPTEAAPDALADRCAFVVTLEDIPLSELRPAKTPTPSIEAARRRLDRVGTSHVAIEQLTVVAAAFGIGSLRVPLFALRAARAAAALRGGNNVSEEDLTLAARLVLAPRATQLPMPADDGGDEQPTPREHDAAEQDGTAPESGRREAPQDVLMEAVHAAIPADLLSQLLANGARHSRTVHSSGAGEDRRSRSRGKPAGTMKGLPRDGARIDLIETLRAAAPWQPLRRAPGSDRRVLVRREDFRIKRSKQRAERVVIFTVDASGSTAMGRLAETKGAIELMLAQAYVTRRQVALIAFRGTGAEILLPPTRSLVMTKRRLARLPGGGGTPLASGISAAMELAEQCRARGIVPHLAFLTDGRGNIALDGAPGRQSAAQDTLRLAELLRASGLSALVVDTGVRPSSQARDLASAMGADYLPLPRANSNTLSEAVEVATGA